MIDIETKLRNMTMPNGSSELHVENISKLNIAKHLTPTKLDGFKFPRPPNIPPIRSQSSSSNCGCSSDSDTQSDSDCRRCKPRHRMRRTCPISISRNKIRSHENLSGSPKSFSSSLPPIGVFWDIENCNVPRGCSAVMVAQVIRTSFFEGYREAEFIVVCDVTKEPSKVIEELNDAQVSLVHVPSLHKNAADEKLRQAMRRFADTHGSPAALVLITSDINFISDVCDLRHRHKIHVILLHRNETAEALLLCANEAYNIETVFDDLPQRDTKANGAEPFQVTVSNLPPGLDGARLRNRLRRVSDNCGGRVAHLQNTTATLTFTSKDLAQRACKRMQGADVFGNKICVGTPIPFEKENGKIQPGYDETAAAERLGTESPQVMAGSNGQSSMSQFAGSFGNAGSNLFGDAGWNVPRQNGTAFRNSQPLSSIHVTYTLPRSLLPALLPAALGDCPPLRARLVDVCLGSHGTPWWPWRQPRQTCPGIFHHAIDDTAFHRCLHVAMEYGGCNFEPQSPTVILNQLSKKLQLQTGQGDCGGGGGGGGARNANPTVPAWPGGDKSGPANDRAKTPDQMRSIVKTHHDRDDLYVSPQPPAVNGSRARSNFGQMPLGGTRRVSPTETSNSYGNSATSGRTLTSPFGSGSSEEDQERFFHPISAAKTEAVELHVSNLDQNLKVNELKSLLYRLFSEHVTVVYVGVLTHSDGTTAARIRVKSARDAQLAISQFHRRKVGRKRLIISQPAQPTGGLQLVKSRIVSLLSVVPGNSLPLVTFFELFESRFLTSASLADVHKLKDVCTITGEETFGRLIRLNPSYRHAPLQAELGQCVMHGSLGANDVGWAEPDETSLPAVRMPLSLLTRHAQALIASHDGSLPLASIMRCYKAAFGALPVAEDGVPLEHLLSCVPGVEIYTAPAGKVLRWVAEKDGPAAEGPSPKLAEQQALLSREILELLKTFPRCQLPFGRLIPAYHHHFSRQCRVADYGFTKLADLLDALPGVVQVMGVGARREVTLSHRAQVRRFTSDLLRVLKQQRTRQVTTDEFAAVFSRATGRDWDVYDYGVCELTDLLDALSATAVTVVWSEQSTVISIPRREQTAAEMAKTAQFASKVTEDNAGDRHVSLTPALSRVALAQQLSALVGAPPLGRMLVADIPLEYKCQYGFALCPEAYGCTSLMQLMHTLRDTIMVSDSGFGGPMAWVPDRDLRQLGLKAWRVLVEHGASLDMAAPHFLQAFWRMHQEVVDLDMLGFYRACVLQVWSANGERRVCLTPTMAFAAEAYHMVLSAGGSLALSALERAYAARPWLAPLPAGGLAQELEDVIAVSSAGIVTLQPSLAATGIRVTPDPTPTSPGFKPCSLLGSFNSSRATGTSIDTPAEQTESGVWENQYKSPPVTPPLPFPSFLEPNKEYAGLPISLPLPVITVDVARSLRELTSPAKSLMSNNGFLRSIESPSASRLPMPTALHTKASSPSADSAANGDSGCGADLDSSGGSAHGSAGKHKRRLAAQFSTPFEM